MGAAVQILLVILSALFPIVDPLSGSPLFLALTRQYSSKIRKDLSRRIALNSFYLLLGSYLIGSHVLAFFGISLPVVQVAGGSIVIAIGWKMLTEKEQNRGTASGDVPPSDPLRQVFYPLTLPLTVGPGSISVAITLGANSAHRYGTHLLTICAALIGLGMIGASIFFCYRFSDQLARILGETATTVIIRLSSFLLVCIGVQIAWNGFNALLASVPLRLR
jgi:multiple antibiotic resistance protein